MQSLLRLLLQLHRPIRILSRRHPRLYRLLHWARLRLREMRSPLGVSTLRSALHSTTMVLLPEESIPTVQRRPALLKLRLRTPKPMPLQQSLVPGQPEKAMRAFDTKALSQLRGCSLSHHYFALTYRPALALWTSPTSPSIELVTGYAYPLVRMHRSMLRFKDLVRSSSRTRSRMRTLLVTRSSGSDTHRSGPIDPPMQSSPSFLPLRPHSLLAQAPLASKTPRRLKTSPVSPN